LLKKICSEYADHSCQRHGEYILVVPGTYQLRVQSNGTTGSYNFRLGDIDHARHSRLALPQIYTISAPMSAISSILTSKASAPATSTGVTSSDGLHH